jgi:large subunit ribosomal protein L33
MAKKGNRINFILESTETKHRYYTQINRVNTQELEIKKFDPVAKKHVIYKGKRMKK